MYVQKLLSLIIGVAVAMASLMLIPAAFGVTSPPELDQRGEAESALTVPQPALRQSLAAQDTVPDSCGQDRVQRTLDGLAVSLPFGWTLDIECEPQEDYSGQADLSTQTLRIRPVGQDETQLQLTLAHEIGHALDREHMAVRERALWAYARGLRGNWYACSPLIGGGESVDGSCWDSSEDFADVFAVCMTGKPSWRIPMHDAVKPSRADCALALALLSEAGLSVEDLAPRED
jgi:hypothetical protein